MRLPALFSDGMVLQREQPIQIWGWAEPGEPVDAALAGHRASGVAAADGSFMLHLPALLAGGPHVLQVRGRNEGVTVRDILIGEVWLCSGQSNMEWPLANSTDGQAAVAVAEHPDVRLITVPRYAASTPQHDFAGRWARCHPAVVGGFSAVGYYFGRELQRHLGVPVGLINASWGGSSAQAWTSLTGLGSAPELAGYLQETAMLNDTAVSVAYAETRARILASLPQDKGNDGLAAGWATSDHDDAGWATMALPCFWQSAGHKIHGVFWFRRTVEVPADWVGQDLVLGLGSADKNDDSYFNGERVGGLTWAENENSWRTPREYRVPSRLVRAGRNLIAVRVLSNCTGGGLCGPGELMTLSCPARPTDPPLPLSGAWRYRIEQDFGYVPAPDLPSPPAAQKMPTKLWNGLIAPLLSFRIRGTIWYQGEANAADAARYRTLFPAMISDWRRGFGQGDFPFYFVQLPNYAHKGIEADFQDGDWPRLREAQELALRLPATGMVVTIDIGEPKDLHPRSKREVGLRLAALALARTYGQTVMCDGPRVRSVVFAHGQAEIAFEHAEGLAVRGTALRGFALAGEDRVFHLAQARLDGSGVVVTCPAVPKPVAVRYGWADCPVCNVYNCAGLPAAPFRSDDWPTRAADSRQGGGASRARADDRRLARS